MKSSFAHIDSPARGGPDSRDRSAAKPLRDLDSSIARSSTTSITHIDSPARGGPDSRDHSAAISIGLKNPSDPVEGDPPKQKSDHPSQTPPKAPPVPTP